MIGQIRLASIALFALLAFTLPTAAQVVGKGSRQSTEAQAFFDKGQDYLNAGQYEEAVEAYKQGIRLNPNNADAYASLAYAYSLLKNATEDLDAAKKALQIEPSHPYANTRLCYAYSKLNQYEQAVQACKKAIQYNPRNGESYANLGYAYSYLKLYPEAIEALQKSIEVNPHNGDTFNKLGWVYALMGQYEDAINALKQSIQLDPNYITAYSNLGNAYSHLGRHSEAVDVFKQAIRIKPEEFWPHMNLGRVYFALEQNKKATEELKEAIRIDPKFVDAYIGLGLAFVKMEKYEEAIESYSELIRLKPQEANAFRIRGYANLYLGHGEAAAADAQKYLELSRGGNKSDIYMFVVAHFGYRQAEQDGDAARILEEGLARANPKQWPYPVLRYLRRDISAQELLVLATDGDKKTEAQAYIGMDLSLAGKRDEALDYLRWVKDNGNKNFVEYSLAISESNRIEAAKEKSQPQDSPIDSQQAAAMWRETNSRLVALASAPL